LGLAPFLEGIIGKSMPGFAKFLIGLGAALLAGWISHGPLGQGEAFIDSLEARSKAEVREAAVAGVEVRFPRDPLTREAVLSGPANDFQREGQGLFPGLNDRIRAVPGVAGVHWADAPAGGGGMRLPLIAETLLLVLAAFLLGVALARFLFRPRREHFL
jgi:hypothetical protein